MFQAKSYWVGVSLVNFHVYVKSIHHCFLFLYQIFIIIITHQHVMDAAAKKPKNLLCYQASLAYF